MSKVVINKKTNDLIFIILMLILPLSQFLLLYFYSDIELVFMAFKKFDFTNNIEAFNGLKNFRRFFIEYQTNTQWKIAIRNSLGYFPVSVLISLPITIFVSYFLYKKIFLHNFFKIVFYIPNIVSVVVLGMIFKNIFAYQGPINNILTEIFHKNISEIPKWFNTPGTTMRLLYFYCVWAGIGGNIVLVLGAMARVPNELLEAGQLDGLGVFGELFQIIIPIIWNTISTLIIFGTNAVFSMFIHTLVLTDGAGQSWTISSIIMMLVKENKDPYYVAALSLLLVIIAVPIMQLVKYLSEKVYQGIEL